VAPPFAGGSWRNALTAFLNIALSVGIENRLYRKYLWMAAERFHRPENNRLPADRAILLRSPRAGTKPASGCDKDGCSPL